MIFIDSNIPMYLVGTAHPNKARAKTLLEELIGRGERLVSNVEVLQEILHRYVAIDRREAIQPALDALYGICDQVYALEEKHALRAKDLILAYAKLSARDAMHVAFMESYQIEQILTFDQGFDVIASISRIPS